MAWRDYDRQPRTRYESDLTINAPRNLASNHKFDTSNDVKQAPFSLLVKGVPSLRGRKTAYKVEK